MGQIKEQIFHKNFRKSTVSFSKGEEIERELWCIYREPAELIMPLGHVVVQRWQAAQHHAAAYSLCHSEMGETIQKSKNMKTRMLR